MIEFVTILVLRDGTFSSHYIGARSIHDCTYKQENADTCYLDSFEALLLEHGFRITANNEELRLRTWTRYDNGLALNTGDPQP